MIDGDRAVARSRNADQPGHATLSHAHLLVRLASQARRTHQRQFGLVLNLPTGVQQTRAKVWRSAATRSARQLPVSSIMASKSKGSPKRLVWRITPNAPMGEWVDPSRPVAKPPTPPGSETEPGNWSGSSFDLLRGSEVNDDPTTQPDTLWDDFFGPDAKKPPA